MYNHYISQIAGKPSWHTIKGDRCLGCCVQELPLHAELSKITKYVEWCDFQTAAGKRETYNQIIFTCHSDNALGILDAGHSLRYSFVLPREAL